MAVGGQSGGLGCKEEKFAASKMVLSRRPQSQSTQLLIRRMGAEARLSPVPACGPPFTLATTPEGTTSDAHHIHTLTFGQHMHPFACFLLFTLCGPRLFNARRLVLCVLFSGISRALWPFPKRDRRQTHPVCVCVCVYLGRFRKMRQLICSTVQASTRCAL